MYHLGHSGEVASLCPPGFRPQDNVSKSTARSLRHTAVLPYAKKERSDMEFHEVRKMLHVLSFHMKTLFGDKEMTQVPTVPPVRNNWGETEFTGQIVGYGFLGWLNSEVHLRSASP